MLTLAYQFRIIASKINGLTAWIQVYGMKNSTKWLLIILGILVFVGGTVSLFVFLFLAGLTQDSDEVVGYGDKVAVVELTGEIVSSENIVRELKKFREDRSVKAVLLRIESPGGGVVASQEIYEEVKKTRDHGKPVVVSMGSVAASGGYYAACGGSRIVANPGTLTGSIGVISQFMRYDSLLKKIGVGVNTVKSGKMKDAGNPFREMSKDDREYFQTLMDDVHHQFVSVVENERKLSHEVVSAFAVGRAFTGTQALKLKLIDTLGTYEDAIMIAGKLAGIKGKPSLVRERRHRLTILDNLFGESKFQELLNFKDELLNRPILQYKMQ